MDLPQRAAAVQGPRQNLVTQLTKASLGRGLVGITEPPYVKVEVEVLVIDPVGLAEARGGKDEALTTARGIAQAPRDGLRQRRERRPRPARGHRKNTAPADVHVCCPALQTQERRVQRAQALSRHTHPPLSRPAECAACSLPTMADPAARFTGPTAKLAAARLDHPASPLIVSWRASQMTCVHCARGRARNPSGGADVTRVGSAR